MKMKSNKHKWAAKSSEIPHDRLCWSYPNCPTNYCPANRNENANNRPDRNSAFHAATSLSRMVRQFRPSPKTCALWSDSFREPAIP